MIRKKVTKQAFILLVATWCSSLFSPWLFADTPQLEVQIFGSEVSDEQANIQWQVIQDDSSDAGQIIINNTASDSSWFPLDTRGRSLYKEGHYREAITLTKQALQVAKQDFEPVNEQSAISHQLLANIYTRQQEFVLARAAFEQSYRLWHALQGEAGLETVAVSIEKADLLRRQGQYGKAESMLLSALAAAEKQDYATGYLTTIGLNNLGLLYQETGDYQASERALLKLVTEFKSRYLYTLNYAVWLHSLALTYIKMEDYQQAEQYLKQSIDIRLSSLPYEHPLTAESYSDYLKLHVKKGHMAKVIKETPAAEALVKKYFGEQHLIYATLQESMGIALFKVGKVKEAEARLQQAYHINRQALGEQHPYIVGAMTSLAEFYLETRQYKQAKALFVKAYQLRRVVLGEDHVLTRQSAEKVTHFFKVARGL